MQQAYREHIENAIKQIPNGNAIFSENIAHELSNKLGLPVQSCKTLVNLNLKRLADARQIERLQRGVYYKPKATVFGAVKPSMEAVVIERATIQDGERVGYLTGDAFRHEIGLITLMPKKKEVATNKYRTKCNKDTDVILRKPPTRVSTDNYQYLQFLDVIGDWNKSYVDTDRAVVLLNRLAEKEKLDRLKLIMIAKKHYTQKVLLRLLDIILEG